jgi:putative peptide zinc metalloprotease protein
VIRTKPILLTAALTLLALVLVAARPGAAAAQDNAAVAVNTKDGTSLFRLAFKIVRTKKDVIDEANVAFALASCQDCDAVAVSFMAVLVLGDPSTVTPLNLAWSESIACVDCLAFAWAYQNVFSTGGPVHFTPEGNRRLANLRRALRELLKDIDESTERPGASACADEAWSGDEDLAKACMLAERLEELTAEFKQILGTELAESGNPTPEPMAAREPVDEEPPPASEPRTTSPTRELAPAETPAATEPAEATETAPSEPTESTETTATEPTEMTETTTTEPTETTETITTEPSS